MRYTYKCSNCEFLFETEQSIKDKPLKKCSECKKNKLERVIHAPMAFVRREVTTVGQLASRNDKILGKGEISERDAKTKEKLNKNLPKDNDLKVDLYNKINKMSNEQKQRYIENG